MGCCHIVAGESGLSSLAFWVLAVDWRCAAEGVPKVQFSTVLSSVSAGRVSFSFPAAASKCLLVAGCDGEVVADCVPRELLLWLRLCRPSVEEGAGGGSDGDITTRDGSDAVKSPAAVIQVSPAALAPPPA